VRQQQHLCHTAVVDIFSKAIRAALLQTVLWNAHFMSVKAPLKLRLYGAIQICVYYYYYYDADYRGSL